MNGDDKEEAHRPRPLSGGIWTFFSWLRRSERSSSSESLSSVGSARTAASFDFLAPGHCNYTNTPAVLTTQLGPPTETYKKRLQDRNLRRQRDRDITLHRKYGLFREFGNGYDGFSLPPARRVLVNSVNRQNRERRAASECLQRRAAYVPGKRRAPLPPALVTSTSLPRSYKRKRQAPKPPIIKETIEEIQINHYSRMNSNIGSDGILTPDLEFLMGSKTEKHDKKGTGSKDVKPKADKSFLKHIFENKKRNSAIETSSLRVLPSISELDKQAAEIIENNKLRQSRNSDVFEKAQNSKTSYEGNSWFCTSCLRKYNSSVSSCNNCNRDKNRLKTSTEKYTIENSLKSSIHTQTKNVESADVRQNNTDERKVLKEILKEMKDSLPKKSRDNNNKFNNCETETPTLRIGSSVLEKYKGSTSQPFSSSEVRRYNITKENAEMPSSNRILSISSLLSAQRHSNLNQTSNSGNDRMMNTNVIQHEVTLAIGSRANKSNVKNASPKLSERNEGKRLLAPKDQTAEIDKNVVCSKMFTESINIETDNIIVDGIKKEANGVQIKKSVTNELYNKTSQSKVHQNSDPSTRELSFVEQPKFESKNTNNSNCENIPTQIQQKNKSNSANLVLLNAAKTHESIESVKVQPMIFKTIFSDNNLMVSNETVVTSNKSILDASKTSIVNKIENHSTNPSTSKVSTDSNFTNSQFKTSLQNCTTTGKNVNINSNTELPIDANKIKSIKCSVRDDNLVSNLSNLHTPLKISTLLNPVYSPRLPVIKENQSIRIDHKHQNEMQTSPNNDRNINFQRTDNGEFVCQSTSSSDPGLTIKGNCLNVTSEQKGVEKTDPITETEIRKSNLDLNALPSTSGSTSMSKDTNNSNKLEHYDRRRHLIKQLEQSIAKGDEAAAAEAAINLAKLKLSCSVLSFSSQIIGESSTQRGRESEENIQNLVTKLPLTEKQFDKNVTHTEATPLENDNLLNIEVDTTKASIKIQENKCTKSDGTSNKENAGQNNEPSSSNPVVPGDLAPIDVWIEDKQAVRGPIRLRISRRATMADLRRQAEHSLGLATHLQRWIVGKTLCNDDSTTVVSLAGSDLQAPFYLCVVQSENGDKVTTESVKTDSNEKNKDQQNNSNEFYTELVKLEQQALVKNVEAFECGVCMEECGAGAGAVLRECIHTFCRECLSDVVQHCQEPLVPCPAVGCSGILQEREIRSIVAPEEYERWLARSLATAECGTRNTFHCRTPDCSGWAFCDPGVRRFPCPVCKCTNCVQCQAIHEGETCEQHQIKLREAVTAAETYKDDEGTQALLNSLISRGEALECPECKAIITKKWGCDWVKCSACKTEICWVTKGRRWGPGGRGDTSGGCRCGVDGQRCHPSCGYCH